jgi:hypothetical protein
LRAGPTRPSPQPGRQSKTSRSSPAHGKKRRGSLRKSRRLGAAGAAAVDHPR